MKICKKAKDYFLKIGWRVLGKSLNEVVWMTIIALLPLIINVIIYWIKLGNFSDAAESKILPGEILSYCLSFLAPSLYLLIKTHGSEYRLPLLHFFSLITLILYAAILMLYMIAKNNWDSEINTGKHKMDVYFVLTLVFFGASFLLRLYSTYHRANMVDWSARRNQQQTDFNSKFAESIKRT